MWILGLKRVNDSLLFAESKEDQLLSEAVKVKIWKVNV